MSDEAEEQWRNWQQALGPREEADRLQGRHYRDGSPDDTITYGSPDDTIAYGSDDSQEGFADEDVDPELVGLLRYHEVDGDQDDLEEENIDNNDEMAQAGAADIAALLAQLTQANIDRNARDVAADGRAAAAAIARGQEDVIRVQVQKIDKCEGDDKPKLRRWVRDLTTLQATQPGIVVTVAERTSRGNLADTLETFLADPVNAPRAGITWPAMRDNVELLLLGEAYGEVLRSEHRVLIQKAHETTGDWSERYLASAKSAYPEPWDAVTNQSLIALFAGGLIDRRMARDVGVVLRKPTLRETLNQARAYAGIEATMNLRDRDQVAAVTGDRAAEPIPRSPTVAAVAEDKKYKALEKQIAAISTQLGEFRAGTRKPPPGTPVECYNCGKPGHFARDCRGGPRRQDRGRGCTLARSPRNTACYNCGQEGHFARECQSTTHAPAQRGRGGGQRGGHQRGRGGHYNQQSVEPQRTAWTQRPAGHQQVAAATPYYDTNQGNW